MTTFDESPKIVVTSCRNGHDNPAGQQFCGECGVPIVPVATMCPVGHSNADSQRFCGDCGAPLVSPDAVESDLPTGRWAVDPTGRHQYRYRDGSKWTDHVADDGTFSSDRFAKHALRHPETWVGIAAGVITLFLLAGAASDIVLQLTHDAAPAPTAAAPPPTGAAAEPDPSDSEAASPTATTTPAAETTAATATTTAAAASAALPSTAVIAAACRAQSSKGVTADGSVAYCSRLATTGVYMWSLHPGEIPFPARSDPSSRQQISPGVAVCVEQTGRTPVDCGDYLKRPSYPGDGGSSGGNG